MFCTVPGACAIELALALLKSFQLLAPPEFYAVHAVHVSRPKKIHPAVLEAEVQFRCSVVLFEIHLLFGTPGSLVKGCS